MASDLNNKTILVTGAGGGIGSALVQQLANEGATVIAVARSEAQLQQLVAADKTNRIKPLLLDLGNWDDIKQGLSAVPQLDGLVNNAGVAIIKPFEELTEKDFDTYVQWAVNSQLPTNCLPSSFPCLVTSM